MFMSGVATGVAVVITLRARKEILPDRRPVAPASFAVVVGTIMRRAAGWRFVSAPLRRTVTSLWASAWFVSHSLIIVQGFQPSAEKCGGLFLLTRL